MVLTSGKQINCSNFKKKRLLVHKEINIKINGMFNECFVYVNYYQYSYFLVPRMLPPSFPLSSSKYSAEKQTQRKA